jgi:hypothetical protein
VTSAHIMSDEQHRPLFDSDEEETNNNQVFSSNEEPPMDSDLNFSSQLGPSPRSAQFESRESDDSPQATKAEERGQVRRALNSGYDDPWNTGSMGGSGPAATSKPSPAPVESRPGLNGSGQNKSYSEVPEHLLNAERISVTVCDLVNVG